MKYHITMDKQNPQITEIDKLTDKLIVRLTSAKKRELFKFAKDNNTTVSKLVREILKENQTI
jgi:hypothetical protein